MGPHNTAICRIKHKDWQIEEKANSIKIINPVIKQWNRWGKEVVLLYKEVELVNLDMPGIAVLLDSCISKKLANRLKLEKIDYERMKVASFGDKNQKHDLMPK